MTRQTHWAPASAETATASQSFIQAPAHSPLIHSYTEPQASRLLATSLGAPSQRHFPQEGRGPKLRCWKAQGPLGSHTCQTRKPGAKPTRSREIGRLDPRLSKGSRQHLRPLGRAARRGRTGRCASRAQGAASAGRGWEASSRPGGAVRRVVPPPQKQEDRSPPGARGRRHSASPPHTLTRPGPPPAAAARVLVSLWAAGAGSRGRPGAGTAQPESLPG